MRRRLKKLADTEEVQPIIIDTLGNTAESCVICRDNLTPFISTGSLDCGHKQFCFDCILQWSKSCNKCPICSVRFNKIVQYREEKLCEVSVRDTDLETDEDEYTFLLEVRCEICGTDDDAEHMLLCDECDKGYHTSCLELLDIPPWESWFWMHCLPDQDVEQQKDQADAESEVKEMPVVRKRLTRRCVREVRSRDTIDVIDVESAAISRRTRLAQRRRSIAARRGRLNN